MSHPTLTDYVNVIYTLFEQFEQHISCAKPGRPFTYVQKTLIVFFVMMQFHRIGHFKAQRRWLEAHPDLCATLKWTDLPHRTTLSRRYKQLYPTVQHVVAFIGQAVTDLSPEFSSTNLVEDKSLFKAAGPVWHQRDRANNQVPEHLRNLDRDATWSKSGYQGWVYGYGLHLTCNDAAIPKLVQVETGHVSESEVIDQKTLHILDHCKPQTLTADDRYTKATRIRAWANRGVALLTPALRWHSSRSAKAYHRFLKEPRNARCLRRRRTTTEPLFDLVAKALGTSSHQKQLTIQRLPNVRMCLSLATLTVQIAMVMNTMWGLPHRNISIMIAACT